MRIGIYDNTIGRELYTAPFIWINGADCNMKNNGGKWTTYDRFEVVEIIIDKKRITGLSIRNTKTGAIVYTFGNVKPKKAEKKPNADVICPKCGKVIQPTKRPNGTIAKPEEVLKGCGMCFECYQASKA